MPSSGTGAGATDHRPADSLLASQIPLARWRELLEHAGWPDALPRDGLTAEAVHDWYRAGNLPPLIAEALAWASDLRTPAAHEMLRAKAVEYQLDASTWPREIGPCELVIVLWLQREDRRVSALLDDVRMVEHDAGAPAYREFHSKRYQRLPDPLAFRDPLKRAFQQWCIADGRAAHVEVHCRRQGEESFFEIIFSSLPRSQALMDDHRRFERVDRIARSTAVRYDNANGKIGFSASGKMIAVFRTVFGRTLFNDDQHFGDEPTCSLAILRKGSASLRCQPGDAVRSAKLIECVVRSGDEDVWTLRSPDCFEAFARQTMDPSTLEFREATVRLAFNRGRRPKTIRIKPPWTIHGTDGESTHDILMFLERAGVIGRGCESHARDLWDVADAVLPDAHWRQIFGREVARLVDERVLYPAERRYVESPEMPTAGAVLEVMEAPGQRLVGISSDPDVPSAILNDTNVSGYRLDHARIARAAMNALGTSGVGEWFAANSCLDLGTRQLGGQQLRFVLVMRIPPQGVDIATLAAGRWPRERVVLIVPPTRQQRAIAGAVYIDVIADDRDHQLGDVAEQLHLADELTAAERAPRARLLVDGSGADRRITIDGAHVTTLVANTMPFRFIDLLAQNAGDVVLDEDIAQSVCPDRENPKEGAKAAKHQAQVALKQWLASQTIELDLSDVFERKDGGYQLGITAFARPQR